VGRPQEGVGVNVSIVVPWRPDNGERDRNWRWLAERWSDVHPDWELIEGFAPDGSWSKGAAVADGVERSSGDVLVVADADSWCSAEIIVRAATLATTAPWVVPHHRVLRLTDQDTARLVAGPPVDAIPEPRHLARRRYASVSGGGIVVLARTAWDACPGPDPRFLDWGGEDVAWGRALDTLVGRHEVLDGDLWHLWHPPAGRLTTVSAATEHLARQYREAHGIPRVMRALVDGTDPIPVQPLDRPATFTAPTTWVVACGRKIRFRHHRLTTSDPDLACALRLHPHVTEVT
jgi:hypothetical protein